MSKLTANRQYRRSRTMSRILAPNGMPADAPQPVLKPGEQQIGIQVGMHPAGVLLTIVIDGKVIQVPMPAPNAIQIGVALIGTAHLYQAAHQADSQPLPVSPELEAMLLESIEKTNGNGNQDRSTAADPVADSGRPDR